MPGDEHSQRAAAAPLAARAAQGHRHVAAARHRHRADAQPGAHPCALADGRGVRSGRGRDRDAARQCAAAIGGRRAVAGRRRVRDRLARAQPLVALPVRARPRARHAAGETADDRQRRHERGLAALRRRGSATAGRAAEHDARRGVGGSPGLAADRRERLRERPARLRGGAEDERRRSGGRCVGRAHRQRPGERRGSVDVQRVAVAGSAQVDRERSAGALRVVTRDVQRAARRDGAAAVLDRAVERAGAAEAVAAAQRERPAAALDGQRRVCRDGRLIADGVRRGGFGHGAARAVVDVQVERRAGSHGEASEGRGARQGERHARAGLDLEIATVHVDVGRRDLHVIPGEAERRARGDGERSRALELPDQLAGGDGDPGRVDQHGELEVGRRRIALDERRAAVELDHAVAATTRELCRRRAGDGELRAEDLEARGRRARSAAELPRRSARPGRVDVALDPAAVVERERAGDREGAVAGDVEVRAADGQARAVDRRLLAGRDGDHEHRVLRAADRATARGQVGRVQLGLVAQGERPADRQRVGRAGVAVGDGDRLPGWDHDIVCGARRPASAAAPGAGGSPSAARCHRAARGRRAGDRDQKECEEQERRGRPAPHAAPRRSRRSFLVRYMAASARASSFSASSFCARHRDADADADPDDGAEEVERPLECVAQTLGDPPRAVLGLDVLAQDGELVTAEARDRVGRAHGLAHARGGLAQQLVPRRVAVGVVDDLEEVEVDEQHGHALVGGAGALDGVRQPVGEEHTVGEPRERVVERELHQPLRGLPLLADVLDLRDEVERHAVLVPHERHAEQRPDVVAGRVPVALLHVVRLALAPQQQAHVLEVGAEVFGVGERLERRPQQLVLLVTENRAERRR